MGRKTSITLESGLENALNKRRSWQWLSSQIKTEKEPLSMNMQICYDLALVHELLKIGRKELKNIFTRNELMLIADVQNGYAIWGSPGIYLTGGLAHNVSDGILLDKLNEKWEIDGNGLLEKLNNLSGAAMAALMDTVAQLWHNSKNKKLWEDLLDELSVD